jgi:glyoxylase-like metal-dependent hydrolase (beta-lactamase superfamily II)
MMIRRLSAAAGLCVAAGAAFAQQDFSTVEIKAYKAADGVFMLEGSGGNIGLSTGVDGAFVIDDQFAALSGKIVAAIRAQTDAEVEFLLNTHFHGDHTGGNEPFAASGARILAHENVRKRLKEGLKRESGATPPAPAAALPVMTFSDHVTFYWNGQEIDIAHVGPAHTDGDSVVRFSPANVIHTGDVFFNGRYPFIDLEGGGDLDGYIAAQEEIAALADDATRIIPGHGPLATRADLEKSTAMLKQVRARVKALIDKGLDEDGVVKAKPLADLDAEWSWRFIDGETMTRTAYRSLTRGE